MRRRLIFTAIFLFAFLGVHAGAQQTLTPQNARTLIGGAGARPVQMKVVDTSKAVAPINFGNSFRPPRAPQTFTLSRVFPKISVAPWPIKLPNVLNFSKGNSVMPTPVNPQPALRPLQ